MENDSAKVVEIAKKHGYEFTEDEFEDEKLSAVNGGFMITAGLVGLTGYLIGKYKRKK